MTRRKTFKLLEHTADVGLVACGRTLPDAFASAALGLFSIIAELKTVRESESRTLKISEDDSEALLVSWLNSLIYLFDTEMFLGKRFEIKEFDGYRLKAVCYGECYQPSRHRLKTGVKAATYHQLRVDKAKNQLRVIFDI